MLRTGSGQLEGLARNSDNSQTCQVLLKQVTLSCVQFTIQHQIKNPKRGKSHQQIKPEGQSMQEEEVEAQVRYQAGV